MKQCIVILLLLLTCQAGRGQSMNQLFDDFARQEKVIRVKVCPFVMMFCSLFTETMGARSVEVLNFDECSQSVRDHLDDAIRNLKDPDFETMVTANEKGSRTKIMVRIDKKMIRELVILNTEKSESTLIRIKGKIKPSHIQRVINDHQDGC